MEKTIIWYYIEQIMNVFIPAILRIFSFVERLIAPFNSERELQREVYSIWEQVFEWEG